MFRVLRTLLQASPLVIAACSGTATRAAAQSYPIDCAILLCLGGGWPASAECGAAESVFTARLMSFEPPLQIWNCPMGVAFRRRPSPVLSERSLAAAFSADTPKPIPLAAPGLPPVILAQQADIDISSPIYDFVRSIHVYQLAINSVRSGHGDCYRETPYAIEGYYDQRGGYHTQRGAPWPAWVAIPGGDCPSMRAIAADWTDYAGTPTHFLRTY